MVACRTNFDDSKYLDQATLVAQKKEKERLERLEKLEQTVGFYLLLLKISIDRSH